ncbi:glutathione S-transferase N-terminal domain-containing protein [Methylopila musalis]|uniref:Glutathione S-transferase N-terminal domain-containing protein n=1 Tax=Methylopila musalis TaxID=1134781 RepID=A0ABW3Z441_9HYPH
MTAHLYDLALADGRRISPYCWAVKLALAHKGVAFTTTATRFTDIPTIAGGFKTVPVLEIGGETIGDSLAIARRLEALHPENPLFAGEGGLALTQGLGAALASYLLGKMSRAMVLAIHDAQDDENKAYFRASRERMFRQPLEEVAAEPEAKIAAAREAMTPLKIALRGQPFLGGEAPLFVDFQIAGLFQWARVIGAVDYLDGDDKLAGWFARLEERYGPTLAATKG